MLLADRGGPAGAAEPDEGAGLVPDRGPAALECDVVPVPMSPAQLDVAPPVTGDVRPVGGRQHGRRVVGVDQVKHRPAHDLVRLVAEDIGNGGTGEREDEVGVGVPQPVVAGRGQRPQLVALGAVLGRRRGGGSQVAVAPPAGQDQRRHEQRTERADVVDPSAVVAGDDRVQVREPGDAGDHEVGSDEHGEQPHDDRRAQVLPGRARVHEACPLRWLWAELPSVAMIVAGAHRLERRRPLPGQDVVKSGRRRSIPAVAVRAPMTHN